MICHDSLAKNIYRCSENFHHDSIIIKVQIENIRLWLYWQCLMPTLKQEINTYTAGKPCIWMGVGLVMPFFFSAFINGFGNFISYKTETTRMHYIFAN